MIETYHSLVSALVTSGGVLSQAILGWAVPFAVQVIFAIYEFLGAVDYFRGSQIDLKYSIKRKSGPQF
jgi:hypothetical protein